MAVAMLTRKAHPHFYDLVVGRKRWEMQNLRNKLYPSSLTAEHKEDDGNIY